MARWRRFQAGGGGIGGAGGVSQEDVDSAVTTAVSGLVDAAPAALNTLNELAAALGDDPDFLAALNTAIATQLTADEHTALDHAGLPGVEAAGEVAIYISDTAPEVPSVNVVWIQT